MKRTGTRVVSALAISFSLLCSCGVVDPGNPPPVDPPPSGNPAFFLPTDVPENTAGSTVVTDQNGGLHSVYRVYSRGDAFYTYCQSTCDSTERLRPIRFKTDGAVQNIMLNVTRSGAPRVLINTSQQVYYAACDSDCTSQGNWDVKVILDRSVFGEAGLDISGEAFVLDAQDRPRFIMSSYPQIIEVATVWWRES